MKSEETNRAEVVPRHVAIIMDGNGRWAKARNFPRVMGHRSGAESVRESIRASMEIGIEYLTLYAFSQENWKRPKKEIGMLMDLLEQFLDREFTTMVKEKIRFRAIGRVEALPDGIRRKIAQAEEKTRSFNRLNLIVALNYGARKEIADAATAILKKRMEDSRAGAGTDAAVSEEEFSGHLYTAGIPDPDLLIRTSGEMRLSNFLLWQCSYSEIHITKKLWPDFKKGDLQEAVRAYSERERRFGDVSPRERVFE